jgi:hypothetical protein
MAGSFAGGGGREEGTKKSETAPPMKWKKIAKAILTSAHDSELPLKDFRARAWEVALVKGMTDRKAVLHQMMKSLTASKQFVVGSKTIMCK